MAQEGCFVWCKGLSNLGLNSFGVAAALAGYAMRKELQLAPKYTFGFGDRVSWLSIPLLAAPVLSLIRPYLWPLHFCLPMSGSALVALLSCYSVFEGNVIARAFMSKWTFAILTGACLLSTVCYTAFVRCPELPPSTGKWPVARKPFSWNSSSGKHVSGLVFYPTKASQELSNEYSMFGLHFPRAFIDFGAPPVIKKFAPFLLDFWIYKRVPLASDGEAALSNRPVVLLSHGNGACGNAYTAIAANFASHGYTCVCLDHSDGSACISRDSRRKFCFYRRPHEDPDCEEYKCMRRQQLETRLDDMDAAFEYVCKSGGDQGISSSFLNPPPIIFAGHSFGGATVLTAAIRWRGKLRAPAGIMALDPAVDWMPDRERRALRTTGCLRQLIECPTFVMYSKAWEDIEYGDYDLLHQLALSTGNGPNHFKVETLPMSTHASFCDIVFLVPCWISRLLGFVYGSFHPHEVFSRQSILLLNWLSCSSFL